MICQQVTLSGDAEWPKVADAVIEAKNCVLQPSDVLEPFGSRRSPLEAWARVPPHGVRQTGVSQTIIMDQWAASIVNGTACPRGSTVEGNLRSWAPPPRIWDLDE